MTLWIIAPQDTLLVRDGRPFSANPGARARSLPFPFPSTTAGAARTRAGQDGNGLFNTADITRLLADVSVRGPLLVSLHHGEFKAFLPPAPNDALVFAGQDGHLTIRPLVPLRTPGIDVVSDLDAAAAPDDLALVGLPWSDTRKPARNAPAFWSWDMYKEWLLSPVEQTLPTGEIGVGSLDVDRRMHVGIDPATLVGRDGDLFMTGGLVFRHNTARNGDALSEAEELGLALVVDSPADLSPAEGLGPLGGERRLAHWRRSEAGFPQPPDGLFEAIKSDKRCRVVLLTPAYFREAWRPDYLRQPRQGATPTLKAAAVGKPQTISGWDLAKNRPRTSRRLAPAGSVYYLELTGKPDEIEAWLNATWFHCISDEEGDRKAGFGLAVVGRYDGPVAFVPDEEEQDA